MSDKVKAAPAPPPVKAPITAALRQKLEARKAELEKELAPAREVHDKHVNDPKFLAAKEKIKKINSEMFGVMNELAALARPTAKASLVAEPGEYAKT